MLRTGILALSALLLASSAQADFPDRPIIFLVGYGPGGVTDTGARTISAGLERCLGPDSTIVVQNMPGAGGQLAYAALAGAQPDGYTIASLQIPNVVTADIVQEAPFELADFSFLGSVYGTNVAIAVRNEDPRESLADAVEAARASATVQTIGIGSLGSEDQLTLIQLMETAGIRYDLIPIDGDANAINSLLGGHLDTVILGSTTAQGRQGEFRVLAISSAERLPGLPDVPTFRESGFDVEGGGVHTVAAPDGLPPEVEGRLADCLAGLADDAIFLSEAEKRGMPIKFITGAEVTRMADEEDARLRDLWERAPWLPKQ